MSFAIHNKDFMLGVLVGLSLTFILLAWSLLEGMSQMTNTLTRYSIQYQPKAAIRMNEANRTRTAHVPSNTTLGYHPDNDLEDDCIARELTEKVKILVMVLTIPENLKTKAQTIKETWGKRCNILIFCSSEAVPEFPTVGLNVPEGRGHLTGKTMAGFRYVYENHFDDADWFMKADDDTYVILENLRYFLSSKDTYTPVYYGHLFKTNVAQGYYSGGSGYVISKEALRRFGTVAVNSTICEEDGEDEDVDLGLCMEKLGVKTSMSHDEMGHSLFHPLHPQIHLLGKLPAWLYRYSAGIPQKGFGVSKYAVSFHYVTPDDMKTLDFYFYHIRPYGINPSSRTCNQNRSQQNP